MNLLERPFDSNMNYRVDVDIQTAEISKDSDYFYFILNLEMLDDEKAKDKMDGVELDNDFDGQESVWHRRDPHNKPS